MIIKVNHRVKDTDIVCEQKWQAMPVLIHTGPQRRKSLCDFPLCLLVEGIPQAPMNAEFHSAAARPMDASGHAQLTADRGLFLFMRIMKSRKIEAECGP